MTVWPLLPIESDTMHEAELDCLILDGILTLDAYTRVIESLKRMGLVEEKNHLLTWVGPKVEHSMKEAK
jgi:hypothetical protein